MTGRRTRVRPLAFLRLVALSWVWGTALACPAAGNSSSLARLVPADAGLCVEITDLAAHLKTFRQSEIFRRLRSFPPLESFLRDNRDAVAALTQELRQQTGLSIDEILTRLLGKEMVVAVWPGASPDALGPALAMFECDDAALVSAVLARLVEAERAAGRRMNRNRFGQGANACDIWRIETDEDQPALYLASVDGLAIVATNEKLVAHVLTLRAGTKDTKSLAEREQYIAGRQRLNPRATIRTFIAPEAWSSLVAAQRSTTHELSAGTDSWLAEEFAAADYLVLSCELGERVVIEGFLHRRDAALASAANAAERDRLAERLPAGARAAFAGRIDLGRLLGNFVRDSAAPDREKMPSAVTVQLAAHEHSAQCVLSALVAQGGRDAVAALLPRDTQKAVTTVAPSPDVDWVVGFDTHSLWPDDRLALGQRVDPILRAGLTAAVMMYNRQGTTMTIDSAEEDGVPLTTVGGLALMGQGNTATFSLLKDYFWAGTSRAAVRQSARLERAESLAADPRFQQLENPRIARPSHLAYLDLAALRDLLGNARPQAKESSEHSVLQNGRQPSSDLRDLAALADRILIELQIDGSGAALSATFTAEPAH